MFVSVFNPLMLLLVAVADSLMLGENLYVGRYNINQLIKSNDFFFLKKVSLSHEKLLFFPWFFSLIHILLSFVHSLSMVALKSFALEVFVFWVSRLMTWTFLCIMLVWSEACWLCVACTCFCGVKAKKRKRGIRQCRQKSPRNMKQPK